MRVYQYKEKMRRIFCLLLSLVTLSSGNRQKLKKHSAF